MSMITPTPSATPPTAKPTVEMVDALRIESMSPCALAGQCDLSLQMLSSEDFLLSTLAPKIDPTTTPTAPVPSNKYAGTLEEPLDASAPGAAPGIGPL